MECHIYQRQIACTCWGIFVFHWFLSLFYYKYNFDYYNFQIHLSFGHTMQLVDLCSPTSDWTWALAEKALSPNHWTTKGFSKIHLNTWCRACIFPLDLKFLNNIIMVWFLHSKLHDFRCTIWWVLVDVYIPVKPPLQSTYLRFPSLPKMSLHPFVIHLSLHSCP